MGRRLSVSWFRRPTVEVAKRLLGCLLVHEVDGNRSSGRIVEVEAYLPVDDPGCHAARGRTPRNATMYGPPGCAYVYFCYGNHDLFNVVTEKEGIPGAVLVRALEPVEGLTDMARRRGLKPPRSLDPASLTGGPGRLTQALSITRSQHDRADLLSGPLHLESGRLKKGESVGTTTRIGITNGWELPLRFYLEGNECLSVPPGRDRPSPGRRKATARDKTNRNLQAAKSAKEGV